MDESKSDLDSFIVHDTDSEDEALVVRKQQVKKPSRAISHNSDDERDFSSDSDSNDTESETASEEDTDSEALVCSLSILVYHSVR